MKKLNFLGLLLLLSACSSAPLLTDDFYHPFDAQKLIFHVNNISVVDSKVVVSLKQVIVCQLDVSTEWFSDKISEIEVSTYGREIPSQRETYLPKKIWKPDKILEKLVNSKQAEDGIYLISGQKFLCKIITGNSPHPDFKKMIYWIAVSKTGKPIYPGIVKAVTSFEKNYLWLAQIKNPIFSLF